MKAAAARLGGGRAALALELVGFDQELGAAMRYVFGNAFVCQVLRSHGICSYVLTACAARNAQEKSCASLCGRKYLALPEPGAGLPAGRTRARPRRWHSRGRSRRAASRWTATTLTPPAPSRVSLGL